jgi:hypothetical protein
VLSTSVEAVAGTNACVALLSPADLCQHLSVSPLNHFLHNLTISPLLSMFYCVMCSNLANKGLAGSLPAETSLWGGLTGLTTLDLAGNSLGGPVPSQITAAGPQLASM